METTPGRNDPLRDRPGAPGVRIRPRAVVAGPLLLALLLAGCTSSGSSSPSAGATTPTTATPASSSPSTTAARAVTATCPTGAAITAAAGSTYPAPVVNSSSGTVSCSYADPASGADLVLVFSPGPGTTAATLKSVTDSEAQAQKVTTTPVPGLGDAAYTFTLNDAATNSSGVATTAIFILDGSELVDITAQATLAQVESVARSVLSR